MPTLLKDVRTIYRLALAPIRGRTHAERLESFYRAQAPNYDGFRRRLLHGRQELFEAVSIPEGGIMVDMGGGTGANLQWLGKRIDRLAKVYVVDLSPSLLEVAQKRARENGWTNVETVQADATTFSPPDQAADLVTFSYSLTMIPDWFAAIDQAYRILRPGGLIGAVDFYVSRKYPEETLARHGWFTRSFWPVWFANDNVNLSADHVPYLHRRFRSWVFWEGRGSVPYLPFLKVPYYGFVGKKPDEAANRDAKTIESSSRTFASDVMATLRAHGSV